MRIGIRIGLRQSMEGQIRIGHIHDCQTKDGYADTAYCSTETCQEISDSENLAYFAQANYAHFKAQTSIL